MIQTEAASCFHCGLPIPAGITLSLDYDRERRDFCCEGCKAVSYSIIHNGLDGYYRQREAIPEKARELDTQLEQQLALYDRDDIQQEIVEPNNEETDESSHTVKLYLDGITCAACIWLIESYTNKIPGVLNLTVNHTNHVATLNWAPQEIQLSHILTAIYQIGYKARPFKTDEVEKAQQKEQKRAVLRLGLAGIGMMQNMMLSVPLYLGTTQISDEFLTFFRWISMIVATPVVFYSAAPFFRAALRDLKTRHLTMDVPVSIAILAAFLASCWITVSGGEHVYFDSVCMFTFFLTLGRFLEMRSRFKASASMNKLATLLPQTANLISPNDEVTVIPTKQLKAGDHVLVRPGETIPCDGEVIAGVSTVDESALTGEHLPVTKTVGCAIIAGTINTESPLSLRVIYTGAETRISSIVKLFEQAISEKPRAAQVADKVASYFVAVLLITSLTVYFFWFHEDPQKAFEITLAVLVVTCPCALSLATPTTFTSALDGLRQIGFLSIRGHVLETLGQLQRVLFDKTGTLTRGEHVIVETSFLQSAEEQRCNGIAIAMESRSSHPLARAFTPEALPSIPCNPSNIQQITGKGIAATIAGQQYRLGSYRFVAEILPSILEDDLQQRESLPLPDKSLSTKVFLADEHAIHAVYHLQDAIRANATDTIQWLNQAEIKTEILSGDTQSTATAVGKVIGIEVCIGGATPEEKLDHLRHLRGRGEKIAMVGDGINDIPVMAAANLSIAMGKASDITKVHADAILLKDDLAVIPQAIVMARRANRILRQNLTWAAGYNLTALPLAVAGYIPPYLAAVGMSLSSLIVVLNALRARKPVNLG